MGLLNLCNLLCLLQGVVVLNGLIHDDRCSDNVAYRTLHLVAESESLVELLSLDELLDLPGELAQAHGAGSRTDSEETLYAEGDNGEQQGDDQTYHETTFIHCTHQVSGVSATVAALEVAGVTKN